MAGGTGVVHLGYCHPRVDAAAVAQIGKGVAYPVNSPLELELAELLVDAVPCAEYQSDGVPCDNTDTDCVECEKAGGPQSDGAGEEGPSAP